MMKTTNKKYAYLFLVAILISSLGCSNDDDSNDGEGSATAHTYDISIAGGDLDGTEFSGSYQSDNPVSIFVEEAETGNDILSLNLAPSEVTVAANFPLQENGQPLPLNFEEYPDGGSVFGLVFESYNLAATSGSATLTNYQLQQSPAVPESVASYTLEFEGTFQNTMQVEDSYQVSGTIEVKPLPEN